LIFVGGTVVFSILDSGYINAADGTTIQFGSNVATGQDFNFGLGILERWHSVTTPSPRSARCSVIGGAMTQ
jgi:hypothetical protein